MVNDHANFAPPLLVTARANIAAALEAFMAATGLGQTYVSHVVAGDVAFMTRLADRSLNIRTYDSVMARFSAIYPPDVAWPPSVPRPAPAEIAADVRADLEVKLQNREASRAKRIAELEAQRALAEAELARMGAAGAPRAGADAPPAQA